MLSRNQPTWLCFLLFAIIQTYTYMYSSNHGRRNGGEGGPFDPPEFRNFNKKGCFLSFDWEKRNLITFGPPPRKILEKSPSALPLQKIIQTTMQVTTLPNSSVLWKYLWKFVYCLVNIRLMAYHTNRYTVGSAGNVYFFSIFVKHQAPRICCIFHGNLKVRSAWTVTNQ